MKRNERITGVLVDVHKGTVQQVTIEKGYDSYCRMLGCSSIDVVNRSIGGQGFNIICSSKALLHKNERPSALSESGEPVLFGNLFIANIDGEGDVCNLREGQTDHVLRHVCVTTSDAGKQVYLMPAGW